MSDESPKCKRSSAAYWIVIILMAMFLGVSMFFNFSLGAALLLFGETSLDEKDYARDEFPSFEEEWSYGSGDTKVVRLELDGVIMRNTEAGLFETPVDMIDQLTRAIKAASNDDDVSAIILEVNSPGGGITESDELYAALMRFKNSAEGRKVIVFMKDMAASGGYYVSMAGDWLIAEPTTVVGAIGVIMQTLNWKMLSDKIGVTDVTIKSGQNKDMLNPFRETNPDELALLQEIIDQMHMRFKSLITAGRGLDAGTVDSLADGRIFTVDKALELDLIDQIGYWDDVVAKTQELLNNENVKIVRYHQDENLWDYLLSMRSRLTQPFNSLHNPRSFKYLWSP